ncbi:MAG: hypothetical protein AVDCRST_MAG87-1429, partial [uncultured Thermomicrobiales bacterium]
AAAGDRRRCVRVEVTVRAREESRRPGAGADRRAGTCRLSAAVPGWGAMAARFFPSMRGCRNKRCAGCRSVHRRMAGH